MRGIPISILFLHIFLERTVGREATPVLENVDIDPDVFRNISEVISSKGFPVEEHELTTEDGYILGIQRIPHGRGDVNSGGPAVLLHHGLFTNGLEFVGNFPDQSLGFVLADSGYDVWITNVRGTRYSKKHVSLSLKDPRYWAFSWDEMALVDLPKTIDYILNVTEQDNIFYVGHSMGTTVLFALLSDKPEYNAKVRLAVSMAPVALVAYSSSPGFLIAKHLLDAEVLLEMFGHGEMLPNTFLRKMLTVVFCQTELQACYNWDRAITGMSKKQLNETRVPVYLGNGMDGSSVHTVLHYGQLMWAKTFQKYDFGPKANIVKYNQSSPPEYVLEKITAPQILMWGLNDKTADPVDVALLAARLKSLVLDYQVPYPEWSHDDFAIGLDANTLVYQEILKQFQKF